MKITKSYTIEKQLIAEIEKIAEADYMGNKSMALNHLLERGLYQWKKERELITKCRNTI